MVFRNNHLIVLPEYSYEILMCWWQRRQAVAVKETLLHGKRITAASCPEVNLFLMNLGLFGSSLASLGPCPEPGLWGWYGFHTWISAGRAEQSRAQQGKQDTSQSPVRERKQPLSFLTTQSDAKYASYAWWDLPKLARESTPTHAHQRYLGIFCWYLQRDFWFLASLENLNLLMWFLFTASSGGWLWPAQLYWQTQPLPSGPATVENFTKQVTSVFFRYHGWGLVRLPGSPFYMHLFQSLPTCFLQSQLGFIFVFKISCPCDCNANCENYSQSATKQHLPKLWAACQCWCSLSSLPCPTEMHSEEGESISSYAPKIVSKQMT